MKLEIKTDIIMSEDEVTSPKDIRFRVDKTTTEQASALIVNGNSWSEKVPANTTDYTLSLGQITQGHWFYLYADADFDLKINGGAAIRVNGSRPFHAWLQFTDLKVSEVNGADLRLTWAVGGV